MQCEGESEIVERREGKRRGCEERKRMEEEWKRERARGDRKKRQLKGKG